MSGAPVWLDKRAVLLHDESLAMSGGSPGLRDEGRLDSALNRPINQYQSDDVRDLASLSAAYAFGIARNHALPRCGTRPSWRARSR